MKMDNFIHVHAMDDNSLHCHVLETVCAEFSLISLTSSSGLSFSDHFSPDLVLINLNHETACVRHLIGITRERCPAIPIIGYLNSFESESLNDYSVMTSESIILMTHQEILLQLREYIRLVQNGDVPQGRAVWSRPLNGTDLSRFMTLSPKEKDIFCLLGKNLGPIEIATLLTCSPRTVETHQRKIGHKLKVSG